MVHVFHLEYSNQVINHCDCILLMAETARPHNPSYCSQHIYDLGNVGWMYRCITLCSASLLVYDGHSTESAFHNLLCRWSFSDHCELRMFYIVYSCLYMCTLCYHGISTQVLHISWILGSKVTPEWLTVVSWLFHSTCIQIRAHLQWFILYTQVLMVVWPMGDVTCIIHSLYKQHALSRVIGPCLDITEWKK